MAMRSFSMRTISSSMPAAGEHVGDAAAAVERGVDLRVLRQVAEAALAHRPGPTCGSAAPPSTLNRLVLPAPLRPTMPTLSRAITVKLAESTTSRPPTSTEIAWAWSIPSRLGAAGKRQLALRHAHGAPDNGVRDQPPGVTPPVVAGPVRAWAGASRRGRRRGRPGAAVVAGAAVVGRRRRGGAPWWAALRGAGHRGRATCSAAAGLSWSSCRRPAGVVVVGFDRRAWHWCPSRWSRRRSGSTPARSSHRDRLQSRR